MRGKGLGFPALFNLLGITPAYAGKSKFCLSVCTVVWDHPRVCGEKLRVCPGFKDPKGSPPRMRGKVTSWQDFVSSKRITPAYAGKSLAVSVLCGVGRDHPRVCGEKAYINAAMDGGVGSPPHVRGKGGEEMTMKPEYRITPACAGKRRRTACPASLSPDHPRVCGEKRRHDLPDVRLHRITPACAGKSS